MRVVARLIHLNGAPGVGKSALASRYLEDHPLALLLDIDAVRTGLGRWSEYQESKLVARDLALVLAEAHLRKGHDVVVPQYVGRNEFIAALEQVAERSGARFVEVLVEADTAILVERFQLRRTSLVADGKGHPQADVRDSDVESTIAEARANLARVLADRDVVRVDAANELDETYVNLTTAIEERSH